MEKNTKVETTNNNFKKSLSKKNKYLILIITLIAFLSILFSFFYKNESPVLIKKIDLTKEYLESDDISYIIHNNKIYYSKYKIENSLGDSITHYKSFVMNEDGTNRKVFLDDDTFTFKNVKFIYKNDAYFYDENTDKTKKVNLENGKISSSDINFRNDADTEIRINSSDPSKVAIISYGDARYNTKYDGKYLKLVLHDLNTGEKIVRKRNFLNAERSSYNLIENVLIDYEKGDMYYKSQIRGAELKEIDPKTDYEDNQLYSVIFKNDVVFYAMDTTYKMGYETFTFYTIDDNYIYYSKDNFIYKQDLSTKEIVSKNQMLYDISPIKDNNNILYDSKESRVYVNYRSNNVYMFNKDINQFEKVLTDIHSNPNLAYKIKNKIIMVYSSINDNSYVKNDKLGYIIVYNTDTKRYEKYSDVRKYSIESDYIKLLKYENDKVVFERVVL